MQLVGGAMSTLATTLVSQIITDEAEMEKRVGKKNLVRGKFPLLSKSDYYNYRWRRLEERQFSEGLLINSLQ